MQGANYAPYAAPAATSPKNSSMLWLILNIVGIVLFCPGSFVFSAIGIVLAAMAGSDFKKGNIVDSRKKNGIAMILFFVGLVFGIISIIMAYVMGRNGTFDFLSRL